MFVSLGRKARTEGTAAHASGLHRPRSGPRTSRILVVDDHEDNREIYAATLRHAGYEVELACDGGEALAIAARSRPRVVVMDLGMPGMDGWEAIRRMRQQRETASAHVIVVSGFADAASRQRAIEAGCDEFLPKPCLPRALIARVELALARGEDD